MRWEGGHTAPPSRPLKVRGIPAGRTLHAVSKEPAIACTAGERDDAVHASDGPCARTMVGPAALPACVPAQDEDPSMYGCPAEVYSPVMHVGSLRGREREHKEETMAGADWGRRAPRCRHPRPPSLHSKVATPTHTICAAYIFNIASRQCAFA